MNNFVWADLSTYDTLSSIAFYKNVFGWQFYDSGGYHVAMNGTEEVAGIYETPDFFKKIKMPHFWMSYIGVEDAQRTAEIASQFDAAKVELMDDFYGGRIALIRDPLGAGFAVYDGGQLHVRDGSTGLCWNELHVSDATKVLSFYQQLFGWNFTFNKTAATYQCFDSNNNHVTDIVEVPNQVKGKQEYWVCTFAVEDVVQATSRIERNGGGVLNDEGYRIMLYDNSGEAFFYVMKTG
ncbi:MAG: VOC family protein [Planctomycetota bacterium]